MARPAQPQQNRTARSSRQVSRFYRSINPDRFLGTHTAEQRAAGARLGAAQARNEALRLRINGQIADAWFGVDALRKVVQIYATRQLPPARSSVDNARNGFQAG